MTIAELRSAVEALHIRYIRVIDDDRIEEWPKLFTDTCLYRVTTRENYEKALPLSIMECRSRGMLEDRVTGLRRINVFEPQRYVHQISGLEVERLDEVRVAARSNFLVVRTLSDGAMSIFSAGVYLDIIHIEEGVARFEQRIAVQDSRRVDTLLVIPL